MLESLMKKWSVESYLVMNSTPIFSEDMCLICIRYKYNYQKVLGFIATEGGGSNDPGGPYLYHFSETYSNFSICPDFSISFSGISIPVI